jgi:CHAT domain-containing protein/Tfp pilus assembly protein PilF
MPVRTTAFLCLLLSASGLAARGQSCGTAPSQAAPPTLPNAVGAELAQLQEKLIAARAADNSRDEAAVLNELGEFFWNIADFEKALDSYTQGLAAARAANDQQQQVASLNGVASSWRRMAKNDKAMDSYQQALDMATAQGDLTGEAAALTGIGATDSSSGQLQKALEFHNRALPLAEKANDQKLKASILRNIGTTWYGIGDMPKALDFSNQALVIDRQVGDPSSEASTLNNIAIIYTGMGDSRKALEYLTQALPIFRKTANRIGESGVLINIGIADKELGQLQNALDSYNQALAVSRAVGNRGREAAALGNMGLVYAQMGKQQKALDCYNQALLGDREVGNRVAESNDLSNIGLAWDDLGNPQKALDYDNQALQIDRDVGNRRSEVMVLVNIGAVFGRLGEPQKALDAFNQALPVQHQLGDRDSEANTLNNIGVAYKDLGDKQKALDYDSQSLALYRQVGDPDGQANVLNDMGFAYGIFGEPQKALDEYSQALPLYRQAGDRTGEADTLTNRGLAYSKLGDRQTALHDYMQALPIAAEVSAPILEALICYNVMESQSAIQPALAIYFGKQAVNYLQQVRGNMQGLDSNLEKSFLASRDNYYHELAKLLIDQGRLPEAQQVLDLLKQQEYTEYVRGERTDTAGTLALTPAEQQAQQDYQKSTAHLITLSEQWSQLGKVTSRTPEQEQQYQQITDALAQANQGLNDYWNRLYKLFGQDSEANKQVADVKDNAAVLRDQISRMPHTVALYTLVTSDRYSVLVITGTTIVAREYAISEADLNQKVAAFREVLRDPRTDPRPLAEQLYNILISPVKADLEQAQVHTIIWSLDGVLRYIPMAALYDGQHYLVENFSMAAVTPASVGHLGDRPRTGAVRAAAMGISRQYDEDLPALPAVVGELDRIVRDPHVRGANGVLPGSILLDDQFTEASMERGLDGHHAIVHIASHFVYWPGDDRASYLLLAGKDTDTRGYHLTVADFRDNPRLRLDNTALLTLSACETGVGGTTGNGREVDGLAMTAQLKGAEAVISTLWSAYDASAGALMADFYQRWAGGDGKVMKVEALREAQLDLLRNAPRNRNGDVVAANSKTAENFSHPYYWAPFTLTGNWK